MFSGQAVGEARAHVPASAAASTTLLVLQQYSVDPAFPAVPAPQVRAALACDGVFEPVHEYPVAPLVQFDTVGSGAQMPPPSTTAVLVQQYTVAPAFPAAPGPHERDGYPWGGVSTPVHAYPVAPPVQLETVGRVAR